MTAAATLFTPITFRNLTIKNRIGVSPMCQYSSVDGFATDWHLVHIGSRAVGGVGLIVMEATAVAPEGRITPACLGIWNDAHIEKLSQITSFAKQQGSVIGIQLAHAGRKASMPLPWQSSTRAVMPVEGGWQPVAPSPVPFYPDHAAPHELTQVEIAKIVDDFAAGAKRAVRAGFQVIEIHGAHGYLVNEFLSPLSNKRTDGYGGSFENRIRLLLDITRAVRNAVAADIVVAVRLSCIDWVDGGWTLDDTVRLCKMLKDEGVDFIDCSSGGLMHDAKIAVAPGYQVPFARAVREQADMPVAAVGMITDAHQADDLVVQGHADMVFIARAFLRDPYWPLHAAAQLGVSVTVPPQYLRGF